MDIKAILRANGVDSELADTITEAIKSEIPKEFVSKTQYNKKVTAIDDLNNKIADLEARGTDEFKNKYEEISKQFEDFKQNIELNKIKDNKINLIKNNLKTEGVNEKLINLLVKEFDVDNLEIEENNIKAWEDVIKPIKENYNDFFAKVETKGNNANTFQIHNNEGDIKRTYIPPTLI